MSTAWYRGGFALCLAVGLVACGPRSDKPIGGQPSWRRPIKVAGSRTLAGPLLLEPVTASLTHYNSSEIQRTEYSPLAFGVFEAVRAASTRMGKSAPVPDNRLLAAALDLASVAPEDLPLPYRLVEFALQRNGIIEPSPHMIVIWGPDGGDPDEVIDKLRPRLTEILAEANFDRIGVGTVPRGGGEAVTIIAFQESYVFTKAIPRALPDGGTVRVEGHIKAPYTDAQVFVTRERGQVEKLAVSRTGAREFRADASCGDMRGAMQIEITAVDSSGSTVLANFPVWCRVEAPTRIAVDMQAEEGAPLESTEDAESRLLTLVNRDRQAHGLPALGLDEKLAEVARAHSLDMKARNAVAHISPTTGAAADRVQAAQIRTTVVLENVARAYGVHEAEAGLMNSPGHRANILSEEATHIGIGIEFGVAVAGRHELFITQLFTRKPAPITAVQAERKLRAAIYSARPLVEDQGLSAVAHGFAEAVAAGEPADIVAKRASEQLNRIGSSFLEVTTLRTTLADVESFSAGSALMEPGTTHFGIGVGKGRHPVVGEDALYVVVLLGKR